MITLPKALVVKFNDWLGREAVDATRVRLSSDPGEHPGSWFLAGAVSISEAEKNRFSALWEKAKPDVIFKDRGGEE